MSNFPDFGWVSMFVGRQSIFIYQNFNWYTIYELFHGKKSADTYKNHQFFLFVLGVLGRIITLKVFKIQMQRIIPQNSDFSIALDFISF